jgi:hypothetical protein
MLTKSPFFLKKGRQPQKNTTPFFYKKRAVAPKKYFFEPLVLKSNINKHRTQKNSFFDITFFYKKKYFFIFDKN